MTNKITLYNKSSKNKIKQWSIWTEKGGYVCKEWGYIDGALQLTKDLVKQKNVGRSNETSLDEQAKLEAERALNKKLEEGYVDDISKIGQDTEIDWDNAIIPDCFAPSKPETSVEPDKEDELVNSGAAIYQRKHNGMRAFIIKGNGTVNIYSRRLELKTANFPEHIEEFKYLPDGTILDCECVADDDPDLIKTIFGADSEKAIERQKNVKVNFIAFDILYHKHKDVSSFPYLGRHGIVSIICEPIAQFALVPVKNINKPIKIPKDWEGLILRDCTSPTKIRWDGKPDRKSGSWKIKNFKEIDMVCYEWMTGKGKLNDNVATLKLGLYDKDGKLQHICESGSGLTDNLRNEIFSITNGKQKGFDGFVVEIKYEEVTPANSLRLPIILRLRPDKPKNECLTKELFK